MHTDKVREDEEGNAFFGFKLILYFLKLIKCLFFNLLFSMLLLAEPSFPAS
jgi:hypothetical protein